MEDMIAYIDDIVEPTIAEFEAEPTSVRRAFLACVVTFLVIDYLFYSNNSSAAKRNEFRKKSESFAIVDRVAHAFKHVITGNPLHPQNKPLSAKEIISRPPGFAGVAFAGLSCVGDLLGGVTLADQRGVDILTEMKNAVRFLRSYNG
jgi:hypothetical protein